MHANFIVISFSIHSVAPLLLTGPSAVNATISENFTLSCNASGYPIPTILWTHNSTTLDDTENDRATITPSSGLTSVLSVLTVSMGAIHDSGEYACIVSSSVNDFQNITGGPVTVLVKGEMRHAFLQYDSCLLKMNFLCAHTHAHTQTNTHKHKHTHTQTHTHTLHAK